MRKMKHFVTIALAIITTATGFSQADYSDCGCPALGARTPVDMALLADGSGNLSDAITTLTCNNTYTLSKNIYVPDGRVLNIEAGTVIKGAPGTGATAKSLIVTQGGKIYAIGTESCPIIFTAAADALDGNFSTATNNAWGGVILLGKAHNNVRGTDMHNTSTPAAFADSVGYIEGLSIPDKRHHYGKYPSGIQSGTAYVPWVGGDFYDDDNSGVLQYVSIRHGGTIIGGANEVNGLTMGSVGRGTKIDHVEVISNLDDAFEFFGGTVNVSHLVSMFSGDDSFDWDQYYSGKGQFLYAVQHPDTVCVPSQTSNGLELDGNDVNSRTPVSNAQFYNVTLIGNRNSKNAGINAKAETGGALYNSIIANFYKAYAPSGSVTFTAGCNTFVNNKFSVLPAGATNITSTNTGIDYLLEIASPKPACADITPNDPLSYNQALGLINPVPAIHADVTPSSCETPFDPFFEKVDYRGAFAPASAPWTEKWTLSSMIGIGVLDVDCPTDVNGDGITNGTDYLDLIGAFDQSCAN